MPDELELKKEVISYDRLYRLWEENPWSATAIDLTVDRDEHVVAFTRRHEQPVGRIRLRDQAAVRADDFEGAPADRQQGLRQQRVHLADVTSRSRL